MADEVRAKFAEAIARIAARDPEVVMEWEMVGAVARGATNPANWIFQSCRRGWERVAWRPHGDPPPLGGQTDGALIRRTGVPCARIGFRSPPSNCPPEFRQGIGGIGIVLIPYLVKTAREIMYATIETLMRPRDELGL